MPILILLTNFIKVKFGIKTEGVRNTVVKENPVKIIEVRNTTVKAVRAETINQLSNKLDNIEKKADEVYEKVKKKKKDKKKKIKE